jgi:hypothetical protein
VGPGVIIGDRVKLQNYALVYEPARLEDEVFIGPAGSPRQSPAHSLVKGSSQVVVPRC